MFMAGCIPPEQSTGQILSLAILTWQRVPRRIRQLDVNGGA